MDKRGILLIEGETGLQPYFNGGDFVGEHWDLLPEADFHGIYPYGNCFYPLGGGSGCYGMVLFDNR